MKRLFYFLTLIISSLAYSQEKIKVSYAEYMNVDIPILQKEQLYIDQKNNKTIWVENVSTQIENYEERKNDFEAFSGNQVFASLDRTIPNDYIIIDYNKKEIDIVEDLGRKVFLVKDNFVEKNGFCKMKLK